MLQERYFRICDSQELDDPGCREFDIQLGSETVRGFLLHWRGKWYAYRNSCPHTGVALNWLPNQFFDIEQEFIQCSLHGALFRPTDGLCLRGPCQGRSLGILDIAQHDGQIVLELDKLVLE